MTTSDEGATPSSDTHRCYLVASPDISGTSPGQLDSTPSSVLFASGKVTGNNTKLQPAITITTFQGTGLEVTLACPELVEEKDNIPEYTINRSRTHSCVPHYFH